MPQIIDLSQEIFSGMPVFPGLPEVVITIHASHEEWDGITGCDVASPAVLQMALGEHTGTCCCSQIIIVAAMARAIGRMDPASASTRRVGSGSRTLPRSGSRRWRRG
jgi:hypothetical protein